MKHTFPHLTLVLGGIASGKSAYAEALALSAKWPPLYLATAEAHDSEMSEKIKAHRARRGAGWTTLEAPFEAAQVLREAPAGHVILLDCLTMWLSNQLFAEADLAAASEALLEGLLASRSPVIAVSNELGLGGIGADAITRRFQREQGLLNQRIAARAEAVIFVTAGVPQALKGRLP